MHSLLTAWVMHKHKNALTRWICSVAQVWKTETQRAEPNNKACHDWVFLYYMYSMSMQWLYGVKANKMFDPILFVNQLYWPHSLLQMLKISKLHFCGAICNTNQIHNDIKLNKLKYILLSIKLVLTFIPYYSHCLSLNIKLHIKGVQIQ